MIRNTENNDYSISSPEATVYVSAIKDHERRQLFNDNWKFNLGDQSNAHSNTYDDSSWDDIELPHDYSLSQDYTIEGEAESGYKLGGIGWYRKSFTMDAVPADKQVKIEFGAIYMNATVYINGHKLGDHPNGYTPFAYDLTDYIDFEGENVLAVRVNHKFPSSRWYSGSGIYRNVHLTLMDAVHIAHYGVEVSTPNLESQVGDNVDVQIKTKITNGSAKEVVVAVKQSLRKKGTQEILASESKEVDALEVGETRLVDETLIINNPDLWSVSNPHLYEVITEVLVDGKSVDEVITDYGFRTFAFDTDKGFYLNGEPLKLQGVSMHSDQGSLGSAAHYRAMERQVEILQDMGVNAIRVTHNPAADEFLEIANAKGVLVIDEAFDTWLNYKNGNRFDYSESFEKVIGDNPLLGAEPEMTWAEFDTKTMVRRGINDPSIISWSIGNEVLEGNTGPYDRYTEVAEKLADWVAEVDTTRPATTGENKLKDYWPEGIAISKKVAEKDGLVGFNYAEGHQFDEYHEKYPEWKMYGAETASSVNSRGVYKPANYDRHLTSYDESTVGWGHLSADSWHSIITRDFMAGEFVWTGFDYLGEPTPWNNIGAGATGAWPSPKSSYFGIVDTAGLPKDRFYFYQSQWNKEVTTLHVLPAWKEEMVVLNENGEVRVDVYSDASSVELIFEDREGSAKSLGTKEFTKYTTDVGHTYQVYEGDDKKEEDFRNLYLTWQVPYENGTVRAIAYDENGDKIADTVGRNYVTTFGEATTIHVKADATAITADGYDLSYITITILDDKGEVVEDASNLIDVTVTGAGELIALDNGDQLDHEPYDSGKRKAFNGKLVAIVKSTKNAGTMIVHAEAENLEDQRIEIVTNPDSAVSSEKRIVSYTLPRSYYVKLGQQPDLAETTTVHYNDGTEATLPIKWNNEESMFGEIGTRRITGVVEGEDILISTSVTIIEPIGALLNYSTVVQTGTKKANLPSSRPIVLKNGRVLEAELPVKWDEQDSQDYQDAGFITIQGVATIFGEDFNVTSTIRVSDLDVNLSSNVAASYLTLRQDIPEELQSDSLEAIVNGDTGFKLISEGDGPNETIWTNYNMAQTGENKAEIIFTFATAQYLGAANLYFYQDALASRLPENVELYWSNEGTDDAEWTKLDITEALNEPSGELPNITKGHYRFKGVSAIGFKIVLISQEGTNDAGKNLAAGLSEVELLVEESALEMNAETTLDGVTLDGEAVSQSQLDLKVINTTLENPKVEVTTETNVAVTVLEPHDNAIRIITESEDNQKRDMYSIQLN